MASTRTDIHRPSAPEFDPTSYQLQGVYYLGEGLDQQDHTNSRQRAIIALRAAGWTSGGVYGPRQCSHCGQHISYAALMLHTPTQTYLHIGEQCLDNRFELETKEQFHALRKATALNREQLRKADRITALVTAHPLLALLTDEASASAFGGFIASVAYKLRRDGRLTNNQINAVKRAIPQQVERAHQEALWMERDRENAKTAAPAPTGRVRVTGKVLTTKWVDNGFGGTTKMLVSAVEGYRVWVSVPANLVDVPARGTWVAFTATLGPANSLPGEEVDPLFAIGTRPVKGEIIPEPTFG